jgi:putative ABC transport system substrate-binding protein
MPMIGFLASQSLPAAALTLTAFRQGLKEAGYVEGINVSVEYRYADSQTDRLPALAAELVRRPVSVIFACGGGVTARAAKAATSTIPIVFANGEDPVKLGLVPSLNRPGGNLTGVSFFTIELGPKRVELLRELVPRANTIAMLVNPASANADHQASAAVVEAAIRAGGQQPIAVPIAGEADVAPAFARMVEQRIGAMQMLPDPGFGALRIEIAALAARHGIATMYPLREYVTSGGLVSYGASSFDAWRRGGIYVAQVLKGAKPADLPVLLSDRFELVINMKAAKALGLEIPPKLLFTADEVIE